MYLFQRIEEAVFNENVSKKTIGEFILNNRDQLTQFSMEDIAQKTFTSKSTLVRFAKFFGYSGWTEFVYAFLHEIASYNEADSKSIDPNFPFSEQDETLGIIEKIVNLKMQSIKDTVSLFSVDDLNQAAKMIINAENTVIFGVSPNCYYGELFKRNLLTISLKANVANSGEYGIISHSLTNKDCAVIISYSGNNPEADPLNDIKYLKQKAVPIIGITSGGKNYLRSYADIVLNISSKERLYSKISNFATQESIMLIFDVLFAKIFSLNYDSNKNNKILNSKVLEVERKTSFRELSE